MICAAPRSATLAQPAKASGVVAGQPQSLGFSGASAGRIADAAVGDGAGVEVTTVVGTDWLGVGAEQAAARTITNAAAPASLLIVAPFTPVSLRDQTPRT